MLRSDMVISAKTKIPFMPFGKFLKKTRDEMGLSPKKFADRLGLSDAQVRGYINGDRRPKTSTVITWARDLDKPPHYFLEALRYDQTSDHISVNEATLAPVGLNDLLAETEMDDVITSEQREVIVERIKKNAIKRYS